MNGKPPCQPRGKQLVDSILAAACREWQGGFLKKRLRRQGSERGDAEEEDQWPSAVSTCISQARQSK